MYTVDLLIPGYPGKTTNHGSLGWCTVMLLRGEGEIVIIEPGSYNYRAVLLERLTALGISRSMVTGVVITHCHWDHVCNYPMFPNAKVYVSGDDLEWALGREPGVGGVPEFHVRELAVDERTRRVSDGMELLPGIVAIGTPGHTPGHMAYRVVGEQNRYLFTGDAAKNRAELLSGIVANSMDPPASKRSVARLLEAAQERAGDVVVCGHDSPFRLEGDGAVSVQKRNAGMRARLTTDFEHEVEISLTPGDE